MSVCLRAAMALFSACLLFAGGVASADSKHKKHTVWVGSFATAPTLPGLFDAPVAPLNDQTVRQVVRLSVGGHALRIRVSNALGNAPLRIERASAGLWAGDARMQPGTVRTVSFGGDDGISIPPGASVLSDAVSLSADDLSDVVVSLYLPEGATAATSPVTGHTRALQTAFVSSGDQTMMLDPMVDSTNTSYTYLLGVDVLVRKPVPVLAALGDSITDGDQSTFEANRRWPNLFAQRLLDATGKRKSLRAGILNLGISGNQVTQTLIGPSAQARLDRDVLAQTGVTHVIVLEGINDIGLPAFLNAIGIPFPLVSADVIIAGHRQLALRARASGLQVIGATLPPSGGFTLPGSDYASATGEAKRQAVNHWIRHSGVYDAVVDFDAVLRDPADPARMRADLTADGLHPNDAGYQAMADAIPLKLLKRLN